MSKTFTHAPKPKPLAPDIISAFERNGKGQDNRQSEPTNEQSHISSHGGNRESTSEASREPTRRLSIDLPASLHRRFKTACSKKDIRMQTEVEHFIARRTVELEKD